MSHGEEGATLVS